MYSAIILAVGNGLRRNHFPSFFYSTKMIRGFTLIELIVVLSIVVISSVVVLFNYNGSRQGVVLSATALDVANQIRIAQAGGRSAAQNLADYNNTGRIILGSTADKVRSGIHMTINNSTISTLTVYRGDSTPGYQVGADIPLEIKNVGSAGIKLRLCRLIPTNPGPCAATHTYSTSTGIEFSRLQSDPILDTTFGTWVGNRQPIIQLESVVGSSEMYRYIVVERTGNIFVK